LGEASLEGVGNEDALKKIMLDAIDPTGITIGNKSLREKLGWSDELFWTIRNKLIDDGLLIKGGGKGGSVFRPSHPE
jgi:type I restriction enzyme M protein